MGRKKPGRQGDEADDDEVQSQASSEVAPQPGSKKGQKVGKKGKRAGRVGDDDDFFQESEEPPPPAAGEPATDRKPSGQSPEDDDDVSVASSGRQQQKGPKKKGKKKGKQDWSDDDDDDKLGVVAAAKPAGKQAARPQPSKKKAPVVGFALLDEEEDDARDEDEEEEDEIGEGGKAAKGGGGGRQQRSAVASYVLLEEGAEEEEEGEEGDGEVELETGEGEREGNNHAAGQQKGGSVHAALNGASALSGDGGAASGEEGRAEEGEEDVPVFSGKKAKKGRRKAAGGGDAEAADSSGGGPAAPPPPRAAEAAHLVVAEVLSVACIPKADKLRRCLVEFGGDEAAQVVCGAPNVREGMRVIFAPAGSRVPATGLLIERAAIRGVESSGMLCSAEEMGWAESAAGVYELDESFEPGADAPLEEPREGAAGGGGGGGGGHSGGAVEEEEEDDTPALVLPEKKPKKGKKGGARAAHSAEEPPVGPQEEDGAAVNGSSTNGAPEVAEPLGDVGDVEGRSGTASFAALQREPEAADGELNGTAGGLEHEGEREAGAMGGDAPVKVARGKKKGKKDTSSFQYDLPEEVDGDGEDERGQASEGHTDVNSIQPEAAEEGDEGRSGGEPRRKGKKGKKNTSTFQFELPEDDDMEADGQQEGRGKEEAVDTSGLRPDVPEKEEAGDGEGKRRGKERKGKKDTSSFQYEVPSEGDGEGEGGSGERGAPGAGAAEDTSGPRAVQHEVASSEPVRATAKGKRSGKKAKPEEVGSEEDIDALLAALDGPKSQPPKQDDATPAPAAEPAGEEADGPSVPSSEAAPQVGGKGKRGKKGKGGKSGRTLEEEAELDAILAELDGPRAAAAAAPPPAAVEEAAPTAGAPAAASAGGAQGPAAEEGGDDDGAGEGGGAESAAARRKKKRKEKEKEKKSASAAAADEGAALAPPPAAAVEGDGGAGAGEEDRKAKKGAVDLKKLPKHVRAMQEALARQKELEEAQRRAEEERKRKEEEEARRLEEEERQKEERKRLKKEREKEKLAQLKREGKLLTPKQRQEARRLAAMREQLLGQSTGGAGGAEGAEANDEDGGAGESAPLPPRPKKPVYDTRKNKRGPTRGPAAPQRTDEPAEAPGTPAQGAETVPMELEGREEDGGGEAKDGAEEEKKVEEQAEVAAAAAEKEVEEEEVEEAEEDDWDAKAWDDDDVSLPALKKRGVFDEEEEDASKVRGNGKGAPGAAALPKSGSGKDPNAPAPAARSKALAAPAAPPPGKLPAGKGAVSANKQPSAPAAVAATAGGARKGAAPKKEHSSEEEADSSEEEGTSDEDSDSEEDESDEDDAEERRRREARERREARRAEAMKNRSKEDLRSPICCILGHVDTGKTKLLDCIRRTNVQEGEAGGITQQIGATYFPMENIRERTQELKADATLKVPGLLVIDTPGHESFTNLRSRGSSLCDIAILVIDIMHGLEPQTLESLNLLRGRKTPFIVALNKVDRMYGWKTCPNAPIQKALREQNKDVILEFERRANQIKVELMEQGLNSELYYKNKDLRRNVNIVPTSAISGEGVPDILLLLVQLTQKMMEEKLMFISEVQCTVLEVKVVEGHGTTIDVVLVNGVLHEGERIVVCGLQGPIVTSIRALLTPHPMKELRVKGSYQHHKVVKAAQGIKISAQGLEHAVAGTQLMVVGPDDDVDDVKEEAMREMTSIMKNVSRTGEGVCVQASTLGSLEALLEFLKSPAVAIPVSGIAIGPVHKKDVMRASVMLERKRKEFAVILAFDVKVSAEAQQMADETGVRVFTADIIYHLFDQFTAYMKGVRDEKRAESAGEAVFPCVIKILPDCVFNKRDPIVVGVEVLDGIAKIGTPICVPSREFITIGRIASIERDHKVVDFARKGHSVAMKIVGSNAEELARQYGRHFENKDELVSLISRESIDILKENFRDDLTKEDWILVVKLKKLFDIA